MIRRVLQLRAAAAGSSARRLAASARLSTRAGGMALVRSSSHLSALPAIDARAARSLLSTQTTPAAIKVSDMLSCCQLIALCGRADAGISREQDVVETLKALCNGLRNDLRAAPPADQSVATWRDQVAPLAGSLPGDAALEEEIRRAYESGVAIATKQRQFTLAHDLVAQMQSLGVAPSPETFQFLIRGEALRLLAQPTSSVDDLRALAEDAGASWEREVLAITRAEENPHYRKTPKERALLRQRLVERIEARLNEYERVHKGSERRDEPVSPLPYNEALRTYADNGVPFPLMLKLMVQRALLPDVDTYAALLRGARWTEVPATISQLLQSDIVDELSATAADPDAIERKSHYVRLLWANAMKAVINSFTDRFFDRAAKVHKQDLDELQKVFVFVEKQLSRAFPKFQFATREHHDEVYALRAKAAATCGLRSNTLKVLDEYVALAPAGSDHPLSKNVFLCALELFTWSQLEILNLSRKEVHERSMRRDVSNSRRVAELERVYERVLKRSDKRKQRQANKRHGADDVERVFDSATESNARLSRDAVELGQRLEQARETKSYQLLIQEHFERADGSMDAVLDKLAAATGGEKDGNDLDVALKLMEQYMTCATRYETRLGERRQEVAPQVMRRVYRVIKEATASRASDALTTAEREQLHELFLRAIRTAVLFWRAEDVDKLVRKKRRVLGDKELDAREYDLLIFQRVVTRDVAGAYALLEEVHNAGKAPSKDALHRIVLGVLHKLHKYPDDRTNSTTAGASDADNSSGSTAADAQAPQQGDDHEDEPTTQDLESEVRDALDRPDADTIEDELQFGSDFEFDDDVGRQGLDDAPLTRMTGADAPSSMVDVVSFLQDWYNLHRVRPAAKTVVPVLARLLATRDFFEFKRLLQILEAMDGGLTPATTVWLELRLAQIGRTIDDFRLHPKAR